MSKLADRLKKAATNDTGVAVEKAAAKAAATLQHTTVETEIVLRTEADIKDNPIYKILNNESAMDDAQIVEALGKYLARDKSVSKEENDLRISQFAEFNRYYQDQMVSLAQKLAEFSHDDALSMYDDTVEGIKDKLGAFKGDIEPLVRALKVIREAEAAGKDPHALIEEVQKMTREEASLKEQVAYLEVGINMTDLELNSLESTSKRLKLDIELASETKSKKEPNKS